MAAAFNIFGLPAYHGMRFIDFPKERDHWERAADAKYYGLGSAFSREDWERHLLGGFGAVTDIGGYILRPELLELYPDAKVVLVERDIEKWYRSFESSVLAALYNPIADFIVKYLRTGNASRKLYEGYFGKDGKPANGPEDIRENARNVYRWHYNTVRSAQPKERLLNYELGSGWEPPCSFLGKPVPDVSFPCINEQAEFENRIRQARMNILRRAATACSLYVLLPALAIVTAMYWMY